MEIAVFSDIHGNYVAFRQCIEYVSTRNINIFIFLGDYLDGFPYPQKTMEMIYALKEKNTCFFQGLPVSQEIKFENISTILACHGSPDRNNESITWNGFGKGNGFM